MQTIDLAPHRLAEVRSADDAIAALRRAAGRARGGDGPLAETLAAFGSNEFSTYRSGTAISDPALLALVPGWIKELRAIASSHPDTGACTVATGLQVWLWTMKHFSGTEQFPVVVPELAGAFGPLLAARSRILEIASAGSADATEMLVNDLCHVHGAHAAAVAGGTCAELVFGYRRHLSWDAEGCATCYRAEELDELEGFMPGIASSARAYADVIEAGGEHPAKAGPCANADGVETFTRLRARLDGCLTGARRAKERAAAALVR